MPMRFLPILLVASAAAAQAPAPREAPIFLAEGPRAAFVRCAVAASFPEPLGVGQCSVPDGNPDWTYCDVVGGKHPAVMGAQWTTPNSANLVFKADGRDAVKWGTVFTTSAADGEVEVFNEKWTCSVRVTSDRRVVVDVKEKSK